VLVGPVGGTFMAVAILAALRFHALTTIGLVVLRRTRPDAERPYRAIGDPVLPALAPRGRIGEAAWVRGWTPGPPSTRRADHRHSPPASG